jgi:hypothetical protein
MKGFDLVEFAHLSVDKGLDFEAFWKDIQFKIILEESRGRKNE